MFDRLFVYYMDRLVWLIVFIVMSNLALEITGVTAQTKDSKSYTETTTPIKVISPEKLLEKDVETFSESPSSSLPSQNNQPQSSSNQNMFNLMPGRSQLLDNIFNIPIATLQAVNDLVQSIAGSIQSVGSRTYFSAQKQSAQDGKESL